MTNFAPLTQRAFARALPTLCLALALGLTTPAPAKAGYLDDLWTCWFSSCDDEPEETTPPAAETGVIQLVYMVGDTFFPDRIHATPGDKIKFYNLTSGTMRVRATDSSWASGYLSKDQSYSFIVQEDTTLTFQKSGYNSNMTGRIYLASVPASVDFGDLIDYQGNIVGKDGTAFAEAEGLGYTLAAVGGTLRTVGNGLAKGLTSALGIGNN